MGIKSEYLQQNEINRNTNMIELNYNYLFHRKVMLLHY